MNKERINSRKEGNFIYLSHNPEETKMLGKEIGKLLGEGDLVALNGDLGAGKTCLIQGIAVGLNSEDKVSSPSFSLIKEYSGDRPIYHFDLYRLNKPEELEDLGYEEYFYGKGITLIEWAEKIKKYLPEQLLLIKIKMSDEGYFMRKIVFEPIGRRYEDIVKELSNIENTGIDTATDVLNLAITDNGKIVADYKIQKEKMTHSAIIIPVLKDILDITGIGLRDIDGIAISIGPGSFTGLRIGLATAKGLVFSLSIPIVGINTLEVYASNWKRLLPGILCPMVKARKGEYYFTLYQKGKNNDDLCRIKPYQCKDWFSIKEELLLLRQPVYIFGYGLMEISDSKKSDNCLENIYFMFKEQEPPGAANVALIGEMKISHKETDNIFELSPFYIRRSAAEIKREEANKI